MILSSILNFGWNRISTLGSNSLVPFIVFRLIIRILMFVLWLSSSWQGDDLTIKVNKLSSTKTQLPYDYYFLKYCTPTQIENSAENLGEVLRGDRIENSVYSVSIHNPFAILETQFVEVFTILNL